MYYVVSLSVAGLSAQCVNTSWLWEVGSSQDGTDTLPENCTPYCQGTQHNYTCIHWPKTSTLLLVHVMVNGNLFFRFEENLSSPPLHEHCAELAEITTSYKVQWREPGPVNIFYQNFHFSPTTSVVRISPPLSLLWHSTHCVHSWEYRHPPLWERTCRVCSGNLHTPIPQWCSVSVVILHLSFQNNVCYHVLYEQLKW